jgi:putative DNA primase/helicase
MWRRIKLIPFDVTIPDERKDPDLGARLAKERAGILGWLIEGCLAYQP